VLLLDWFVMFLRVSAPGNIDPASCSYGALDSEADPTPQWIDRP
jgi:hypothetical protein